MKQTLISILLGMGGLLGSCVSSKPKELAALSVYSGTTVRVSSSMLKLTSLCAGDGGNVMRKLKSVEVFTCEDRNQTGAVMEASRKIAQERGMEVMIETRSAKESTEIYALESGKKGVVKEVLIQSVEPDECEVIYLKGNIDVASLVNDRSFK